MGSGGEKIEDKARQVLLATQLFFFAVIAICVLISHSATTENDGISFFAVYHLTIPLIVPGFCVAAYGMWRTAAYFASSDAPQLTVLGLRVIAVGLLLLLVTPFNRGTVLNWTHMTIGVLVALVELVICFLLLVQHRAPGSVAAFFVALAGGIIAAFSLPDWHFEYLLQGEIVYEIGFSWCLIEWTYALHARRAVFGATALCPDVAQ
jgi:hypothetical protein